MRHAKGYICGLQIKISTTLHDTYISTKVYCNFHFYLLQNIKDKLYKYRLMPRPAIKKGVTPRAKKFQTYVVRIVKTDTVKSQVVDCLCY